MRRLSDASRLTTGIVLVVLGAALLFAGRSPSTRARRSSTARRSPTAPSRRSTTTACATSSRREIVVNLVDRGSTDLVAARPLLESVVDAVVQTQPFRQVFRRAALETNKVFFVRDRSDALVNLGDAATRRRLRREVGLPQARARDPRRHRPGRCSTLDRDEFAGQTLAIADKLRLFGWLLPALAAAAFVAAVALGPDRRVAVLRVGVGHRAPPGRCSR